MEPFFIHFASTIPSFSAIFIKRYVAMYTIVLRRIELVVLLALVQTGPAFGVRSQWTGMSPSESALDLFKRPHFDRDERSSSCAFQAVPQLHAELAQPR